MSNLTRKEEQILLAICHLNQKAYLISIREKIKEYTGKYYSVGTIYAPLNRLFLKGYLESFLEDDTSPGGGKRIRYYKLTRQGFTALHALREMNKEMWQGIELPILGK